MTAMADETNPCLAAGLAAQQQAIVAVRLLGAVLALQTAFTVLALALRPYISLVLNCIEVACGCLEIAYLSLSVAAYMHNRGAARQSDAPSTPIDPHCR